MEMLLTAVALLLVTAASVAWHLRSERRAAARAASAGGDRSCPRCAAPVPAGTLHCPGCGAPLQAFEQVAAPVAGPEPEAAGGRLHALVRADTCVGCGACVGACPVPGAIRLEGKLATVDVGLCQGHGECVKACPVGGIVLSTGTAVQRVEVPELSAHFESNVPGLYVVGELGGRGLIKNAVNEGRIAVEHVTRAAASERGGDGGSRHPYDVIIVGSGPAGLSAGLEALRGGLRYLVLEQGDLSDTIHRYPRHKILLAEPVRMPVYGELWVADASKESLLRVWRAVIASTGLEVRTGHRVTDVRGSEDGGFEVLAGEDVHRARRVVLAMGRRGTPRRLEVPGEERTKVFYDIVEMEAFAGRRVLVVGGGDSAVESAVGLAAQPDTEAVLSYRGDDFRRVKERNRARLEAEEARGRLRVLRRSRVLAIGEETVELETADGPLVLPNDFVIVRAGGEPPYDFLRRVGVRIVTKELALAPGSASGAAG